MSPEQALGRDVDHRSDIFSFGVVLYEMATGSLPFIGETVTGTIDRIAHAQPESIARLNYDVPPELEVIIKKTLRKDRDKRYQSIHDVLVDLKDLRRELDISERLEHSLAPSTESAETRARTISPSLARGDSSLVTSTMPVSRPTSSAEYLVTELKRHKKGVVVALAAVAVAFAALAFIVTKFSARKPAPFQSIKITKLTNIGNATTAQISPNGE